MTKKEIFLEKIRPYVEAGFLREVASSDKLSVYNFCDRCYLASHYDFVGKHNDVPIGVIIDKSFIKSVISDDKNLVHMLQSMSNESRGKITVEFSPRTKSALMDTLNLSKKEGPSQFIDYQLEEELLKKNKSR